MNDILDHTNEMELDRFEARYFERMNEVEAASFDAEIQKDPEMALRYRAFRLVVSGIRSTRKPEGIPDRNELRARLVAVDAELDRNERKNRNWLPYAAAAAVVIGAIVLWLFRPPSNEALANEFQLVEPGLPVLMNTDPGTMDAIMNAYKQEQFTQADSLLRIALQLDPVNDTLHYFSGVVAERIYDCDVAMEHYDQLIASARFTERAIYRKAICKLRAGKKDEARTELMKVQEASDPQVRQRAVELLDHL